jgi:HK97 family phage prohead protease
MLQMQIEVAAIDTSRRLIEGTAVPYGEVSEPIAPSGRRYRFAAGALTRARRSTPFLLGHDTNEPVGVIERLVDGEHGAQIRARIDRTPDGDRALEQARTGSRGSISIGFEVDDGREASDGVINVARATLWEASLVAIGAWESAQVERVAAERDPDDDTLADGEPAPAQPNPAQTELDVDGDDDEHDDDELADADDDERNEKMEPTTEHAGDAPAILMATRGTPALELNAGEFVRALVGAKHGDAGAGAILRAALAESVSTDVSGLLPPTYERSVIGGKSILRPLYEAFRSRPLPGVGLLVNKPKWVTPPNGAWAVDVNADATTNTVTIDSQSATVIRWDWAGAIPWVVVQRSDPSIVDEIYAEAVEDFYLDVEAKVYGELGAAAPGVATTLGAAIAEFFVASGNQRAPELIIMAPDVWGKFADTGALSVALAQGGAVGSSLSTSFAGIPSITSGTLPPGETILATRRAVDARTTEPVRLTANAIGALNVELAVVGEGLFDTDYPGELLKFAAIVPAAAGAPASSSSRGRSSS